MRAAVVREPGGGFQIENVELAEPTGREIVVDVKASGLCNSDVSVAREGMGFPMPVLLGHEVSGIVTKVGPDARTVSVGDRIVVCMVGGCGLCVPCRSGKPFRCLKVEPLERGEQDVPRIARDGDGISQFMGIGGLAEQILVHENLAIPIGDDIPFDVACLLGCGVVTGAGAAINTAGVRPGDTVAVIGCGGVGLNTIQGARIAGASRVIAVDLQQSKLELARSFGATDVVNPGDGDPVEAVTKLTGGGVNYSFEVIGLKQTAEQAVHMLAVGGTALLIGVQRADTKLDLDLFGDLIWPQRRVLGVSMGSTNPLVDIPMYADLYRQGRLELDALVSERIGLDELDAACSRLASGSVARAVVTSF